MFGSLPSSHEVADEIGIEAVDAEDRRTSDDIVAVVVRHTPSSRNRQSDQQRARHGNVRGEGCDYNIVRAMGIDVGTRRIGLAISDVTRTLARPLKTIDIAGARQRCSAGREEAARLAGEDDGLSTIVVGLPVRLDGSPNEQTARVAAFIAELSRRRSACRSSRPTSGCRASKLRAGWRFAPRTGGERKKKLDAAAAAVILQDYLDRADNVHGGT